MLNFAASESKPVPVIAADTTKLLFEFQGKLQFEHFLHINCTAACLLNTHSV